MSLIFSLLLMLMLPRQSLPLGGIPIASAGGTPTFIAARVASGSGSFGTTLSFSHTPSGSGHALYYFVGVGTGTITSLTDSTGSPTSISSGTWNGGSGAYASYRLSSASTSAHTITATYATSPTYGILYVVELSNSSASGGTSVVTTGSTANPIPCGSSFTVSAGSIALGFGYVFDGSTTLSAGSGPPSFTFPTPSGTPFTFTGVEYSGATTATTYNVASGFAVSGFLAADAFMCYVVEAKP